MTHWDAEVKRNLNIIIYIPSAVLFCFFLVCVRLLKEILYISISGMSGSKQKNEIHKNHIIIIFVLPTCMP